MRGPAQTEGQPPAALLQGGVGTGKIPTLDGRRLRSNNLHTGRSCVRHGPLQHRPHGVHRRLISVGNCSELRGTSPSTPLRCAQDERFRVNAATKSEQLLLLVPVLIVGISDYLD